MPDSFWKSKATGTATNLIGQSGTNTIHREIAQRWEMEDSKKNLNQMSNEIQWACGRVRVATSGLLFFRDSILASFISSFLVTLLPPHESDQSCTR